MRYLITSITICLAVVLSASAVGQLGANHALANPNLAGEEELGSLPHLDDRATEAIVNDRPYLTATQLDRVLAGFLSEAQREDLYRHLFRPINLNSASRSEIMLIPGMSERMAHEFEEYRPYSGMEEFRREIGKYVDPEEVARLEQYVFVPMNLNEASPEDFMTIPGMTERMVHEFLEYRPYTGMEEFRREIGKYVDEQEVARLESYVTLD